MLEDFRYIFNGSFRESITDIFGVVAIIIIIAGALNIPGF